MTFISEHEGRFGAHSNGLENMCGRATSKGGRRELYQKRIPALLHRRRAPEAAITTWKEKKYERQASETVFGGVFCTALHQFPEKKKAEMDGNK